MRRATGYLLILLLSLAGCGGCGEDGDGPDRSSSPSTGASSSPSDTAVPKEPGGGPVEDESDRDDGGSDDGNDAEDERAFEIGGPTLDNTYPTNPFHIESIDLPTCTLLTNDKAIVPVKVLWVRLVNQKPSRNPGLVLGANPSANFYCKQPPEGPGYPESIKKVYRNCTNARLVPAARTACPVEVRATGKPGIEYTATLTIRLSAVCTGLTGQPCSRLSGRAKPSASDPITVVWRDTRRYSACFVPTGSNGLPDEDAAGPCAPDDPNLPNDPNDDPPPSTNEPDTDKGGSTDDDGSNTTEPQPSAQASPDNGS